MFVTAPVAPYRGTVVFRMIARTCGITAQNRSYRKLLSFLIADASVTPRLLDADLDIRFADSSAIRPTEWLRYNTRRCHGHSEDRTGKSTQAIRRIGEATVRVCSELPQGVQHHLFEAAVGGQEEGTREELAILLRSKQVHTTGPLKAKTLTEPDSRKKT